MGTQSGDSNSQIMAALAYLGILVLIPYLMKPANEFAAFHVKQGIRLFLAEVATTIAAMVLGGVLQFAPALWLVSGLALNLLWIGWFILSIVGIVNVVQKKKVPLPLIGKA